MAEATRLIRRRLRLPVSSRPPAPSMPFQQVLLPVSDPRALTASDVHDLQRTVGNHATGALLPQRPPQTVGIQRELKIDEYEWSWAKVPFTRIGVRWATGAEDLYKKLKKAFDTNLPAAIKTLADTGDPDLNTLAESLRGVRTKYNDQPLAYKKTSGKLSGAELDADLAPLLAKVDQSIAARKLALATAIRNSLSGVSAYIGSTLANDRAVYDRINKEVPKALTVHHSRSPSSVKSWAKQQRTSARCSTRSRRFRRRS